MILHLRSLELRETVIVCFPKPQKDSGVSKLEPKRNTTIWNLPHSAVSRPHDNRRKLLVMDNSKTNALPWTRPPPPQERTIFKPECVRVRGPPYRIETPQLTCLASTGSSRVDGAW